MRGNPGGCPLFSQNLKASILWSTYMFAVKDRRINLDYVCCLFFVDARHDRM